MPDDKRSPDQPIPRLSGLTLGDFWSWAFSDILSNATRGVFAEFLVGSALDALDQPRLEWDGCDLRYAGKRIEVKSSAYLQSWQQDKLSRISFDIARKQAWDASANSWADETGRYSDCYVFCVYAETDPEQADALNIGAWEFYVLATSRINDLFGTQKSLSLNRLRQFCNPVAFLELRETIDAALATC